MGTSSDEWLTVTMQIQYWVHHHQQQSIIFSYSLLIQRTPGLHDQTMGNTNTKLQTQIVALIWVWDEHTAFREQKDIFWQLTEMKSVLLEFGFGLRPDLLAHHTFIKRGKPRYRKTLEQGRLRALTMVIILQKYKPAQHKNVAWHIRQYVYNGTKQSWREWCTVAEVR